MRDRESLRAAVEAAISFEFARSGGPGGQNVNKVNTKVLARLPLEAIEGLGPEDRERLKERLGSRLVDGEFLQVQVQETRSQVLNRAIAVERVLDLLVGALSRPRTRRPTRPTRSSKERRLASKRLDSEAKRRRGGGYEEG